MASWKSFPGEPMYKVKLGFENTLLLFAKPSYAAEASLNMKYTQRRFSETKVLLANDQSGEGLSYLSQQVQATKAVIDRAPDAATRKVLARHYISTLEDVSSELSVQRGSIAQATTGIDSQSASGTTEYREYERPPRVPTPTVKKLSFFAPAAPTPTPKPVVFVQPTSTPAHVAAVNPTVSFTAPEEVETPTPQPESNVVEQIDDTQEDIQKAIDELQALADESVQDQNNNQGGSDNSLKVRQDGEHKNDNKKDAKDKDKDDHGKPDHK